MKSKNIKVGYSTNYPGRGTDAVPKIQLEGKWLKELGFSYGSTVIVEIEENAVRIRPYTEDEQIQQRHQQLQKELSQKSSELLYLESEYKSMLKVAEPSNTYNSLSASKS